MMNQWYMEKDAMIREIWDKTIMVIGIPIGAAFVALAIFGQLCLDDLPYLTCGGQ